MQERMRGTIWLGHTSRPNSAVPWFLADGTEIGDVLEKRALGLQVPKHQNLPELAGKGKSGRFLAMCFSKCADDETDLGHGVCFFLFIFGVVPYVAVRAWWSDHRMIDLDD